MANKQINSSTFALGIHSITNVASWLTGGHVKPTYTESSFSQTLYACVCVNMNVSVCVRTCMCAYVNDSEVSCVCVCVCSPYLE